MKPIEQYFRDILSRAELGHAYYIEVDDPDKEEELGSRLSRLISCEKGTGCGSCESCKAFDSGNHPDIIRVRNIKNKTGYSIDDLRSQLIDDIQIRPYRFPRKIYYVPHAEQLNPQTQNAMLKTLEEPPSYGLILLTGTNRNALLPTVLSRLICLTCQENEEGDAAEPSDAFGEAIDRLLYLKPHELAALAAGEKGKTDPQALLSLTRSLLRDIYLLKGNAKAPLLLSAAESKEKEYAGMLSEEDLARLWKELEEAEKRISVNVNPTMVLQIFFMHLQQALRKNIEK